MGRNIIYFSRFPCNPSGNGGDKRVAQICDMLSTFNFKFVSMCDMVFPYNDGLKNALYRPTGLLQTKLSNFYKQYITYWKYLQWHEQFRECIVYWHTMSKLFVDSIKGNKPDLLLIDDPVFLAPVAHYAKSNNIPIVAFCHNIETLSREQVNYSFQHEIFKYELDLISQCDLVVAISKEETFLLQNLGINPVYLPYFPLQPIYDRFQQVRTNRQHTSKSDFLLFGTVYNLPTQEGMRKAITTINSCDILGHDRLIVAGYGTKERITQVDNPRIEVRGDLSDTELDELLTTVKGCIVYQENGSGALTKIPELLAAGVPVIINSHAARSHHNLPGIFEFAAFEGLQEQMDLASKSGPFPQVLSPPDTTPVINRIYELLK